MKGDDIAAEIVSCRVMVMRWQAWSQAPLHAQKQALDRDLHIIVDNYATHKHPKAESRTKERGMKAFAAASNPGTGVSTAAPRARLR